MCIRDSATVVPYTDNKFAALNSAVWSGGSFIYVPKGVKLEKPLQSYFRINSEQMGQFERTLIIVDEGADVHYVEGCTAPTYSKDSLHAAVVEIIIKEGGKCRYSTVQNWSDNIINLVTKRAKVDAHGAMEWIDGNIGSQTNMKYPACLLVGEYARGMCISIAVASRHQVQDAGAKMIHLAPHTSSTIISKSVSRLGGEVNYRGLVQHGPKAEYARSKVECDTLILDEQSRSDKMCIRDSLWSASDCRRRRRPSSDLSGTRAHRCSPLTIRPRGLKEQASSLFVSSLFAVVFTVLIFGVVLVFALTFRIFRVFRSFRLSFRFVFFI